jgi:hypothetical protein
VRVNATIVPFGEAPPAEDAALAAALKHLQSKSGA